MSVLFNRQDIPDKLCWHGGMFKIRGKMTSLYRVVCGISQEKNEIYAAIHKAEKGLHQNMFWSLQMEHPEVKSRCNGIWRRYKSAGNPGCG